MLQVGERAPDIDALASDGQRFVLSAQGGLCTVVFFYPKAFTPNCNAETTLFRENYLELMLAGAKLVGISTDSMPTQCKFAGKMRVPFPLVPDPDRHVCKAWGVLRPILRVARRATFVIGPDLTVKAVFQHEFWVRHHRDDVLAFVNELFRANRAAQTGVAQGPAREPPAPPPPLMALAPTVASPGPRMPSTASTLPSAGVSPSAQTPIPSSAGPRSAVSPTSSPRNSVRAREVIAGRFELERRAASGASGDIHVALDRVTGRHVALKLLREGPERDEARFEREARILSALNHPGVVAYVAHGTDEAGNTFLATEWLEGESLAKRLGREPPLTLAESLALGLRVAATLGVAHAHGIIHRDLKPTNLFLPGGDVEQIKLLDFGVSRPTLDGNQLTTPGDMIGTPGYMAPEQARGKTSIDARADVFSLGCVIFRCVTGREAFLGDDVVTKLLAVVSQEVPPARSIDPTLPQALSDLLDRMLSKDPEGRPRDASKVAEELARIPPPRW
ncbi:protein kinase domain-containing protein [Chondromyces crocatus]|uniref:Uncharacterized protein n=1 Tax=Chondromyces crocatus TaxID=52 RepID=A0A0K1EC41_CHOCO|nr:redoxin domain-containing protein [Chondromyces crocatus]AKT38440.1 uncharacterized protein CMC5_025860 [Chondromyces crocatus]